jgi:purine-nucleoside phosphorylase
MTDQLNLTGTNPLVGHSPDLVADRFVPMLGAFDAQLRGIAHRVAYRESVLVKQGVYAGLLGPSLETPAEIRMLEVLGADTVAMSVVEEVIAARHVGMRVFGMSLCSNMACGIEGASPSDEEVFEVAKRRQPDFCKLISELVRQM